MSIALSVSDKGSHLNCGTLSCSRQEKLVNTPFFLFCCVYIILLAFFSEKGDITPYICYRLSQHVLSQLGNSFLYFMKCLDKRQRDFKEHAKIIM